MRTSQVIDLVGYASGIAAGDPGCGDGPEVLFKSEMFSALKRLPYQFKQHELLFPSNNTDNYTRVADICTRLAEYTQSFAKQQHRFIVLGGDHSCAIGTWSGACAAIRDKGRLGLIWIDAHLDSHTPDTSESGNIHGMPVASLLGRGAQALTQILIPEPKLHPENLCIIGARSFEAGEAELIKRMGVRVFYMDEIQKRGLEKVFEEAKEIVSKQTAGYGVSIDLDGIDPNEAPGVGTPEPNGIHGTALCKAVEGLIDEPTFLGMEVVEFNPHHDQGKRTEQLVFKLIQSMVTSEEKI